MPTFVRPKTMTYNKGVLVIHSDDGKSGDFTHWLPLAKKKAQEHSQWYNVGTVVMNPAINTATIGTSGKMTVANVQELLKNKWEILSHGRHHVGIGAYPLILSATAGATRLDIQGAEQINTGVYQYRLFEGSKEEVVTFATRSGDTYGNGYVTTTKPLVNSYTTAARIQLTEDSAFALLQGCIDDAKAWGVDIKHHVYTYHGGGDWFPSQKSEDWVGQYFKSGRGSAMGSPVSDPANINLKNIKSALNTEKSNAAVDSYLNQVALNNGLMLYYGHGETDDVNLAKMEYLIDGALSRGIRIMTMTDALKHFGLM